MLAWIGAGTLVIFVIALVVFDRGVCGDWPFPRTHDR